MPFWGYPAVLGGPLPHQRSIYGQWRAFRQSSICAFRDVFQVIFHASGDRADAVLHRQRGSTLSAPRPIQFPDGIGGSGLQPSVRRESAAKFRRTSPDPRFICTRPWKSAPGSIRMHQRGDFLLAAPIFGLRAICTTSPSRADWRKSQAHWLHWLAAGLRAGHIFRPIPRSS